MKLNVKDATFSYDNMEENIFEDISFSLKDKEVFCILGPNGSGKTTLLKCINNLLELKKGSIFLDDRDIRRLNKREIAQGIGYIPQTHDPTFPFSIFDVVLMGRSAHLGPLSSPSDKDRAIAEETIEMLGISHLKDKPYTKISGGERQLVLFARTLVQQPKFLLMDEPTSHLDFGNQIRTMEIIEKLASTGLSIIMTSHFPDHAFLISSRVAIIKRGKFIDIGSPDDVITEKNLENAYGIEVKVVYIDSGTNRKICVPVKKGQNAGLPLSN